MNKTIPHAQDWQSRKPTFLAYCWLASMCIGVTGLIGDFTGWHQTWLVNPYVHGLIILVNLDTLRRTIKTRRLRIETLARRASTRIDTDTGTIG